MEFGRPLVLEVVHWRACANRISSLLERSSDRRVCNSRSLKCEPVGWRFAAASRGRDLQLSRTDEKAKLIQLVIGPGRNNAPFFATLKNYAGRDAMILPKVEAATSSRREEPGRN